MVHSEDALFGTNDVRMFSPADGEVAFPLGGIGTGNVSLGARGQFRDWELQNTPAKGLQYPYASVLLRCEDEADTDPVLRVVEAERQPPFHAFRGLPPTEMAGVPRMDDAVFTGEYPIATIDFEDDTLPVDVSLTAYTPFIPLNPEDSGIPVAILEYTVRNPGDEPVEISLAASLPNPVGGFDINEPTMTGPDFGGNRNTFRQDDGLVGVHYTSDRYEPGETEHGDVSLLIRDAEDTFQKPRWGCQDHLGRVAFQRFLNEFEATGRLCDDSPDDPTNQEWTDVGSIGRNFDLEPGASERTTLLICWNFPTRPHSWEQNACSGEECECESQNTIRNQYATRFDDSWDVGTYVDEEFDRLRGRTLEFHDAFFDSTLPGYVLEAVSSHLSVVRSTTCLWLEDGTFLGYEGSLPGEGCCPGTCTHVWNYAWAVARLFPSLEREMRRINFEETTGKDGFMPFRTPLPLDEEFDRLDRDARPAADGQMGTIMRLYREWRYSGDDGFLERLWPDAKRALEFAFDEWDPDEDGVMTEAQHNTYDIEFYGPNTMMGTWYLGALKAGAEMAREVGDEAAADRYERVLKSGREALDERCWNGEYYQQALQNPDEYEYQYGRGCLIDQLVGQWYAEMLDFDDLLPGDHITKALESIYEYNFLDELSEHIHPGRTYALNDEQGIIICTWPQGGRPELPFWFAGEVMSGFEYQVAAHMIQRGMITEGLEIVNAIRERHDGRRRNPWNEPECGNHYVRTMASWAVYEALCGFSVDLVDSEVSSSIDSSYGFEIDPVLDRGEFRCFWITNEGWGTYKRTDDTRPIDETVEVLYDASREGQSSLRK